MNRWQRTALAVWTTLVLGGVGRAALYDHERHRGCYDIYPQAGSHWLRSEGLFNREDADKLMDYRYHPLVAVGCVPLTVLPDPLGSAVLRVVNFAFLFVGLFWWGSKILRGGAPQRFAQWFLLIALAGGSSLFDVQLTLFTTGLLLIAMAAIAEERWNLAALALGVAICCKAYPISLALLLGMLYPRHFVPRMVAVLLLLSALPFAAQTAPYVVEQYENWLRVGLHQTYIDGAFQDVMHLLQRWVMPMRRNEYTLFSMLVGAAIALATLLQRRRVAPEVLLESVFGMCCAWMMAFGPATEATTYVMLAPMAALAVVRIHDGMSTWSRFAVVVSFTLLALGQLQLLFSLNRPIDEIGGQAFAAILLILVYARWRPAAVVGQESQGRESGRFSLNSTDLSR